MRKGLSITVLALLWCVCARGQEVLTLEELRSRALESNNALKRAEEKVEETRATKNVALWQMLPKVSANGTYMWTEKSVNLLSDEQKERLNNLGTNSHQAISSAINQDLQNMGLPTNIQTAISNLIANGSIPATLNGMGAGIVEALETDSRNVTAGMVTVTQPIYMGGKLMGLYRTASLLNRLAGIECDKEREAMLIGVDEAYWQVVSVKHKKELAEQYAALLDTLNHDVEEMVAAEVATRGDLTKVRVKLNEAQMSLTKATNGLALAKMLLAQRCGMPLNSEFDVQGIDAADSSLITDHEPLSINMESVMANRRELRMLRIGDSIAREGVRMARSTLLPNVAVTGGYLVTNPNLFNGFEREFAGTFTAGVVVNVPILHPGSFYSLKAAKHKRKEVEYQLAEAQEMVELQVNKLNYELELAYKKLAQAQSNLANAEENLKLADESFKAGAASSSDLMAAQTAWFSAKGDILDARIEIEMDRLYLKQALGE